MASGPIKYIDPFNEDILTFDGKNFDIEVAKQGLVGSRITYSDIILHSFKISTTSSEEEIANTVEIKMYEEAGLDIDKKYKISYVKKELDYEETYLVEAFAIEIEKIEQRLESVLEKSSYIDYVALPFLSFSTLYKNKIIAPKSDLFIYFGIHEAFLAIYSEGKYLSTKSLINLTDIVKKLDLAGVEITPDELREHLHVKGLEPSAYERGETVLFNELENIFSEIFTKVNDVVIYNRSVFGFEKIDRIFLSMQNGRIKGVKEFMTNFGYTNIGIHDFNLFKHQPQSNFFSHILTSYIFDELKEGNNLLNFTIYPRKAPLYKREVGKIIIVASLILTLFGGYIGYLYSQIDSLELEQQDLDLRYNQVLKNYKRYNQELNKFQTELSEISQERQKYSQRYKNISQSVEKIEKILYEQKNYMSFIDEINRVLEKYSLSTTNIEQISTDTLIIDLIASNSQRENIAQFMIELLKRGYVSTNTKEIKSDNDVYLSKIEVKR